MVARVHGTPVAHLFCLLGLVSGVASSTSLRAASGANFCADFQSTQRYAKCGNAADIWQPDTKEQPNAQTRKMCDAFGPAGLSNYLRKNKCIGCTTEEATKLHKSLCDHEYQAKVKAEAPNCVEELEDAWMVGGIKASAKKWLCKKEKKSDEELCDYFGKTFYRTCQNTGTCCAEAQAAEKGDKAPAMAAIKKAHSWLNIHPKMCAENTPAAAQDAADALSAAGKFGKKGALVAKFGAKLKAKAAAYKDSCAGAISTYFVKIYKDGSGKKSGICRMCKPGGDPEELVGDLGKTIMRRTGGQCQAEIDAAQQDSNVKPIQLESVKACDRVWTTVCPEGKDGRAAKGAINVAKANGGSACSAAIADNVKGFYADGDKRTKAHICVDVCGADNAAGMLEALGDLLMGYKDGHCKAEVDAAHSDKSDLAPATQAVRAACADVVKTKCGESSK